MIDVTTLVWSILGFSAFNLILGYTIGHLGLSTIKSDLATIKGLISGQEKVTVVTPVAAPVVSTPVATA